MVLLITLNQFSPFFFPSRLAVASHPELTMASGPEEHFLRMETSHDEHARGEYGRMGSKPLFCHFLLETTIVSLPFLELLGTSARIAGYGSVKYNGVVSLRVYFPCFATCSWFLYRNLKASRVSLLWSSCLCSNMSNFSDNVLTSPSTLPPLGAHLTCLLVLCCVPPSSTGSANLRRSTFMNPRA
ncbi:uncharacterized protein G2W53_007454 [Senna tora]|uniref:Uncharacterized protein n=1 Tax=Senna tora TaxID=362788 RepID=A0A834X6B2_9FABA|nr:uncharacterized protein G2W53_007454 [Senna tora]